MSALSEIVMGGPGPMSHGHHLSRVSADDRMITENREVNWALGGAALGLTVAIVEYLANNVFDK